MNFPIASYHTLDLTSSKSNFCSQDKTINYLEAQPGSVVESTGKSVLLLHGEKYSMDTWRYSIKTIQFLAAAGYHVVSTDIPGMKRVTFAKQVQIKVLNGQLQLCMVNRK